MHIACLTFTFLTVSSMFVLLSLQRPFCIPPTIQTLSYSHFRDAQWSLVLLPLMSTSTFLLKPSALSDMFLFLLSDLCNLHHPVSVAVVLTYMTVIQLVILMPITHCNFWCLLNLHWAFFNTRCRQWRSLESQWVYALSRNNESPLHFSMTIGCHFF